MLQNLFQITGEQTFIIMLSVIGITSLFIGILIFKLILAAFKAEEKTGIKWVAISYILQLGLILMIASPFILLGFAGVFQKGDPAPGIIVVSIILAIFVDINVLNIIHKTGLAKALGSFFIMIIPLIIGGVLIVILLKSPLSPF